MATETKDPQKKSNAITRFLGEFKEFISKGNVLDMAVGVVVGSAFTAIVNALVDNVLMPLVGAVIAGINFQDLGFHIPWGNHPYINIGAFLSAVITFLITAFCIPDCQGSQHDAKSDLQEKRRRKERRTGKGCSRHCPAD